MKKLINAIDQVENQMVTGMAKAYPQYLRKLDCGNVVVRADKKEGKVALISGGGSGHERGWIPFRDGSVQSQEALLCPEL